MAKVKFTAFLADMRGKVNGSVFSRNKGGAYVRTKVTPNNPQTSAQVNARALLSTYSQNWKSLTAAQRAAWNAAVSNFLTTDIFGDIKTPTGKNLYVRLNANIINGGGSAITSPPLPSGVPSLSSLSVAATETSQDVVLTFAATPVPSDTALYVEATDGLSPGVSNANSKFRFVEVLPATTATGADIASDYIAKFGALTAGEKIFIRAKQINLLTGEVSQSQVASAIVGA